MAYCLKFVFLKSQLVKIYLRRNSSLTYWDENHYRKQEKLVYT